MIRIVAAFLILILSVWVGLTLSEDPGYLLISYKRWTLETPLWFSFVVVISTFVVLHLILRFIRYFNELRNRFPLWLEARRIRNAHEKTSKGLVAMKEGRWKLAEKELVNAASNIEVPMLNYLAAARSAQEQGDNNKRDEYIQLAYKVGTGSESIVELTQAKLQIEKGQLDQALVCLEHLQSKSPNHPYVLTLLKELYVKKKDWDSLMQLFPALSKYKIIKSDEKIRLEASVFLNLLDKIDVATDKNQFEYIWDKIPKYLKLTSKFVARYAKYQLKLGSIEAAEKLLVKAIKKRWSNRLVRLYGKIESKDVANQLKIAETWLSKHLNSADLLRALARISRRNQLWGKARSYYEESLHLSPKAQTYSELGDLLQQLGETELSAERYREGLIFLKESTKDLLRV